MQLSGSIAEIAWQDGNGVVNIHKPVVLRIGQLLLVLLLGVMLCLHFFTQKFFYNYMPLN